MITKPEEIGRTSWISENIQLNTAANRTTFRTDENFLAGGMMIAKNIP